MLKNFSAASWEKELIFAVATMTILILFMLIIFMLRYKRCPSNKIMVVYGKLRSENGEQIRFKCIHGGGCFVWPIVQAYGFLDIAHIPIDVVLTGAKTKSGSFAKLSAKFKVGISILPGEMQVAAEKLLGLPREDIGGLAEDVIHGQLRLLIATTEVDDIKANRDIFLDELSKNIEEQLKKFGLNLKSVNLLNVEEE